MKPPLVNLHRCLSVLEEVEQHIPRATPMVVVEPEINSVSDRVAKKSPLRFEFKFVLMHGVTDMPSLF
jgi:hypothetical protein